MLSDQFHQSKLNYNSDQILSFLKFKILGEFIFEYKLNNMTKKTLFLLKDKINVLFKRKIIKIVRMKS